MTAQNAAHGMVAEPEADRSIVVERLLNAPRDLVFDAFTSPEHLAHWWGPDGFSLTTSAFEFAVGGVWRFVMHGPDGRDYQNRIVFDVIERPSRIIARHDAGDEAAVEQARHEMRILLASEGRKTRLTWQLVFPSSADRDRIAREYGAVEGCQQTTARLGDYAAGLAA